MHSPSCLETLPRQSGGLPQRRPIAIHRMAPSETPRLIEFPHNYLLFGKWTSKSPPHTRAFMFLFCSSHSKLSSEIEILHLFFARGSQNAPISLAHSLLGGSVLLPEASACKIPRAFQPMTTPQAHTRQHSHHSIATAASIPLSITGISSPCRSARATSKRETPAEEMWRDITITHAQHRASTLPPGILRLPLRTFLILHSYAVAWSESESSL